MNEAVKIAVSNESLSILDLILQASLLVPLGVLVLVSKSNTNKILGELRLLLE